MRWICALLVLTVTHSEAQNKWQFRSQTFIGLLEGQNSSAFQIHSINGFQHGVWFAGMGAGLDYYYVRSLPVFLSLNRDLSLKDRRFFLAMDGGLNFAWGRASSTDGWRTMISNDYSPGWFYGGGIGYKLTLKKRDMLLFQIGYSFKQIKEQQEQSVFCINPPCPPITEYYNYRLRRLSLKAGYAF